MKKVLSWVLALVMMVGVLPMTVMPVAVAADQEWGYLANIKQVSGGSSHTIAIKTDGSLWAWGSNSSGELGDGTTVGKILPTRISNDNNWDSVSAGYGFTLAIKNDSSLWAWGYNGGGRLGDGTTVDKHTPTRIGNDSNWDSVSTGSYHSVAIKEDGSLWVWGNNSSGQLGLGNTTNRNVPTQVGSNTDWSSVSTSGGHTLAIKTDGSIWAWGNNDYGQLGNGTTTGYGVANPTPSQIGAATNWASVSAGNGYTLAIKDDGSLWGWGHNNYGLVAGGFIGTESSNYIPVQIDTDTDWSSVSAFSNHTMAIKTNGSLWAWGYNKSGQLGDGTTDDRNTPVKILPIDTVTVINGTGGGNYAQGVTVTVKADATLNGKRFKEWGIIPSVIIIGGRGIDDFTTKFTMPAQSVTVTAVYEDETNIYRFIAPITPITDKTGWTAISDRTGLEAMRENLSGKYYLTADIDLSGEEWVPINDFTGTFDGQGHVIRNLTATNGLSYGGLFGTVDSATIKNVGIEGTNNIGLAAYSYSGGICGRSINSSISNCYNIGDISVTVSSTRGSVYAYAGGICGQSDNSIISNCYSMGNISAYSSFSSSYDSSYYSHSYAGGICGQGNTKIINCYNTGDITATSSSRALSSFHSAYSYAGGIYGYNESSINNCYNTGDIFASHTGSYYSSSYAGGISGYNNNSINNCYNKGDVSVPFTSSGNYIDYASSVGGISGINNNSVSNCYNIGDVSIDSYRQYAGGISGINNADITNCYYSNASKQLVHRDLLVPTIGVGDGSDLAESRTPTQMKDNTNTALYFLGFDFNVDWSIKNGVNEGYPILQVFFPSIYTVSV